MALHTIKFICHIIHGKCFIVRNVGALTDAGFSICTKSRENITPIVAYSVTSTHTLLCKTHPMALSEFKEKGNVGNVSASSGQILVHTRLLVFFKKNSSGSGTNRFSFWSECNVSCLEILIG